MGWLTEASIPCLMWWVSLKKTKRCVDILHEIVPHLPRNIFSCVFAKLRLCATTFSPSDLGSGLGVDNGQVRVGWKLKM